MFQVFVPGKPFQPFQPCLMLAGKAGALPFQ